MQTTAPAVHLAHATKPVTPRDRLLRLPDVEAATGCKKSTIYKLMKEGKFPACVRITARMSAWPESAIFQWVQDRIKEGGAK
jgi:prophage regulatory protein